MTMKIILIALVVVLVVLLIAFFLGPRVEIDTTLDSVELPPDLDAYLKDSEGRYTDIVPGTEKTIAWAGEKGRKTPLSIIYLHGFSASRQETVPLTDRIASTLGANLFYTRFAGHGRGGAAMAEGSVNDWLNDAYEALEIGRRLGDRVIVVGVSTGGSVATWLGSLDSAQDIAAIVTISPNFGPIDWRSDILLWPWGEALANLIVGEEYSWEAQNEGHERYWTHRYPTKALLTMMGLAHLARSLELEAIETPILTLYSKEDRLVSPRQIERAFQRIGSPRKRLIPFNQTGDGSHHVLAGDILSPESTSEVAAMILSFIRENTGDL